MPNSNLLSQTKFVTVYQSTKLMKIFLSFLLSDGAVSIRYFSDHAREEIQQLLDFWSISIVLCRFAAFLSFFAVLISSVYADLSIFTFRAFRFQITLFTPLAHEQRNRHAIFSSNYSLTFHFQSSWANPLSLLIFVKLVLSEKMVFVVLLLVVTIGKIILFFTTLDFNKTLKITKTAVSQGPLKLTIGILFCLIVRRVIENAD